MSGTCKYCGFSGTQEQIEEHAGDCPVMTNDNSPPEYQTLCFRCEHRAKYLESKNGPRCECKSVETSVYSCYMYTPVKPVIIAKNENDKRPQFVGSAFSARSHGVKIADLQLSLKEYSDGNMIYWVPKESKNGKSDNSKR